MVVCGACPELGGFGCGEGERVMPSAALDRVPAEVSYHRKCCLSNWCQKRLYHSSFLVFDLSPIYSLRGLLGCVVLPLPCVDGRLI